MRRPLRVLISAVVVVSLAGGGYLVHRHTTAPGAGSRFASGAGIAGNVDIGPALTAMQPALAPSAAPSARGTTAPRSTPEPPKATPTPTVTTPKPSKTTPKPTKTTPPAGHSTVEQLLAQINDLRAQHGLPPYTLLSGLDASAHKHNLRMMGSCGMSHQCPGEASLGSRISAEGVHWTTCGENIGWSGPHPDTTAAIIAAAEGLTTSMYGEKPPNDGHRLNLLSAQFHHIGIDVIRDSSGKVWLTQDFSN